MCEGVRLCVNSVAASCPFLEGVRPLALSLSVAIHDAFIGHPGYDGT